MVGILLQYVTGHKSEQSLADYDQLDLHDHRKLSNIISGNHTVQSDTVTVSGSEFSSFPIQPAPFMIQNCNMYFGLQPS